jgi:hypothetical protein
MALGRKTGGKRKGSPKSGGRKAGTPNKLTTARLQVMADAVAAEGLTPEQIATIGPLDTLLLVMRKYLVAQNWPGAVQAASAAAPYMHAKLTVADIRLHHDAVDSLSDREIAAERELLLAKRAAIERVIDVLPEPEPASTMPV